MQSEPARLPMVAGPGGDERLEVLFAEAARQQGQVSNLYRTLANSPAMLQAWTGMAWPLRHEPRVDRRLRELGIMRVAQRNRAVYEWAHHWRLAVKFGVRLEQLESLRGWPESAEFDPLERAVLGYADAICDAHVPDEAFDPLLEWFDAGQLVELTLSLSFYCHVSRALIALRIELEPGFDPHLEAL